MLARPHCSNVSKPPSPPRARPIARAPKHLLANGRPRYTNRLILEDSPYLLQHAHNPVDWYPWGREAFDKAHRDAAFAIRHYGITPSSNFEGGTILHLSKPLSGEARARLDRIDAALLKARQQRPRPPRDDKVLTGWNGLMITALAEAGDRLDEPRYLAAARRAAEILWQHHRRADGGLWRV